MVHIFLSANDVSITLAFLNFYSEKSSWTWRHFVRHIFTDVAEEHIVSVFMRVLYPEDGDDKFVRNVDNIPDHTASLPISQ
jgi:hypothetical protein